MVNAILAKRVNHIVTKGDNPAWPKGSKSRGFSTIFHYDQKRTSCSTEQTPPRLPIQQELSFKNIVVDEISQILGTKEIDLDANFFELGIDSKNIVKIWRGVTDKSRLKFPLTSVFEHTTVRKLAQYLEMQKK